MIRSFRDADTGRVFRREHVRWMPPDVVRAALRKLLLLDAAGELADLRVPPGNCLEKLSKDRVGQYSIRIDGQWRVCFVWKGMDAWDVEIVDYHEEAVR